MATQFTKDLLELYKIITDDKSATLDSVKEKFKNRKITKPMVHSSDIYGKMPSQGHILEDDITNEGFEFKI